MRKGLGERKRDGRKFQEQRTRLRVQFGALTRGIGESH
jgi:hypothetical protein